MALDLVCQLDALVEVSILHEVKHDIALRRRRVEALVSRLIVALEEHRLVLAHRHAEVVGELRDPQHIGLRTVDVLRRSAVDVDAEHEGGFLLIRKVSTGLQTDEDVRATRVEYTYLGVRCVDLRPDELSYREGDILLLATIPYGTRVLPPVTGVDDDGEEALGLHPEGSKSETEEERKYRGADVAYSVDLSERHMLGRSRIGSTNNDLFNNAKIQRFCKRGLYSHGGSCEDPSTTLVAVVGEGPSSLVGTCGALYYYYIARM